jgi:phosphatidylserine decarboxylase
VAKRAFFSRFYGWRMKRRSTRRRIAPFIEEYCLDPSEFADEVASFGSFNDFFIRKLKPAARPVDPDPRAVVFPADGRHLGFAEAGAIPGIYAKGQRFDLSALLGAEELAERYRAGAMVVSRLCPVDYHRFHFPVSGIPAPPRQVNGALYSVNPIALRRKIGILWENKRILTRLRTESMGEVLLLEIGATNVGSIVQTHAAGEPAVKGGEKGYFEFGGSMTITLFEAGRVRLAGDLLEQTVAGRELYARMGDRMGEAVV